MHYDRHCTDQATWTEDRLSDLPDSENAKFERKAGALLDDLDFRSKLAKAVSAFANSGGGQLIIGQTDIGKFDGVEEFRSGTRTRTSHWLEQVLPKLVEHPLSHFQISEVIRSTKEDSRIPLGRVVLIIDIPDSPLAPHQSVYDHKYYHRRGGRSEPASHFYLELLRNRLIAPRLQATPMNLAVRRAFTSAKGLFVQTCLEFEIRNIGRVAAYKWAFEWGFTPPTELRDKYVISLAEMPEGTDRSSSIRVDDTILPGFALTESRHFGLYLADTNTSRDDLLVQLHTLIPDDFMISVRLATEVSPGERILLPLWGNISRDNAVASITAAIYANR
ncbi:MAG: ATP-binding protein [Planctomycetota bacterium]|nr:ATP-binding protein [Planctomycetota bacterium]